MPPRYRNLGEPVPLDHKVLPDRHLEVAEADEADGGIGSEGWERTGQRVGRNPQARLSAAVLVNQRQDFGMGIARVAPGAGPIERVVADVAGFEIEIESVREV
jgi:hypothetical protein